MANVLVISGQPQSVQQTHQRQPALPNLRHSLRQPRLPRTTRDHQPTGGDHGLEGGHVIGLTARGLNHRQLPLIKLIRADQAPPQRRPGLIQPRRLS